MMLSILKSNPAKQIRDFTIGHYDNFLATKVPIINSEEDLKFACDEFISQVKVFIESV